MTEIERTYAEQRMQQKWYELVLAEQQGASQQQLERLYNSYMLAVEDYNQRSDEQQVLLRPDIAPREGQMVDTRRRQRKAS
jgi:hypothetical protein